VRRGLVVKPNRDALTPDELNEQNGEELP